MLPGALVKNLTVYKLWKIKKIYILYVLYFFCRGEDEMILLTLQDQGDKPTTYQQIADNIQNRTVQQVSIIFIIIVLNLVE